MFLPLFLCKSYILRHDPLQSLLITSYNLYPTKSFFICSFNKRTHVINTFGGPSQKYVYTHPNPNRSPYISFTYIYVFVGTIIDSWLFSNRSKSFYLYFLHIHPSIQLHSSTVSLKHQLANYLKSFASNSFPNFLGSSSLPVFFRTRYLDFIRTFNISPQIAKGIYFMEIDVLCNKF